MRKSASFALLICIIPLLFSCALFTEQKPQSNLEPLPDITLIVPKKSEHIQYLGLKGMPGTPFKLSDIDADILMIELFSMYCPHCQHAAPYVNELYELMEQDQYKDLKLVIVGIGTTNTDYEVDLFRKGYKIVFPLFSDNDISIYNALKGDGTPTFVASKTEAGKKVIFFRKAGGFENPPEFLQKLLNLSGLR